MLPARLQFPRSTTLEVYFGVLRESRESEEGGKLRIEFRAGSGQNLRRIPPKKLVVIPSVAPQAYLALADFDLGELQPGGYTIEITAEDTVERTRATQRAEFTVQ